MIPTQSSKKTSRTYSKHGLTRLKAAVKDLGERVIDGRTAVGKSLARWRAELLQDLGGSEAVPTQELAMVDLAVKTKLLLDSVDAWLLTQPSLVNVRKRMFTLGIQSEKILRRPHIPILAEDNIRQGFLSKVDFLALQEVLPDDLNPVVTPFPALSGRVSLGPVRPNRNQDPF